MNKITFRPSPFFDPGPVTRPNSLAILHLSRDQSIPVQLRTTLNDLGDGSHEEAVVNTRFGSFPHSTLLGLPWGSQVLASKVNTGGKGKKRKRDDIEHDDDAVASKGSGEVRAPVAAQSGFIHILPPTPETWTISLPHRTQVVYTPDYSFILQRLQVRPGSVIIEAGAGSGSFSHAAARAVFNGYPSEETDVPNRKKKRRKHGKVYSFEFHEGRARRFQQEIDEHGLGQIIQLTHRDVCEDGFVVTKPSNADADAEPMPQANAVFLDLPAPWLALKHLTRSPASARPSGSTLDAQISSENQHTSPKADSIPIDTGQPVTSAATTSSSTTSPKATSPLDPLRPIHLCTFSPCIEQVQRTVSTLRQLGWLEISMFELSHHRIDVRRERIGLQEEGLRGVNATPATVEEAVERLKELEEQWSNRRSADALDEDSVRNNESGEGPDSGAQQERDVGKAVTQEAGGGKAAGGGTKPRSSKQERLQQIKAAAATRKLYKEGRLVHRTEPELKTHTSYLVFAVLPRQWTSEDEEMCGRKWPVKAKEATVEES